MTRHLYRAQWTLEADTVLSTLEPGRREKVLAAVDILRNNPYDPRSQTIAGSENERAIQLTDKVVAEYAVLDGQIIIVILRIYDGQALL